MIEKWQGENYFIFASDPICMHAENNSVDMQNIKPIGGAYDKFLNLSMEMVSALHKAGIEIDAGSITALIALDDLPVEELLENKHGILRLRHGINRVTKIPAITSKQ